MAKSLILNILVDILGNYVEDLTNDHLKLAVWSGKIELLDLKIKSTALDKLKLPIHVGRGLVKKLSLKIPWANLDKKPVSVVIDGLFLEAGPLDLSSLSKEESERMKYKSRYKKMEKAENVILASIQNKEELQQKSKKASFIKKLTNKIIDNLEVTVTNLHIRYEDEDSIPDTNLSCGITIESISLLTTDDNWIPAFIIRELEKKKEIAINKLGVIKNCNIYWNASSILSKDLSFADWEAKMLALIYSNSTASKLQEAVRNTLKYDDPDIAELMEPMSYILTPPNQYTFKLTHKEISAETIPNTDLLIESDTIPIIFDDEQYRQIQSLGKVFKDRNRRKLLVTHRPLQRPTEDPVAWWHYAYRLLTGRDVRRRKMFDIVKECTNAIKIYIPYCVRRIIHHEVLNDLSLALEGNELDRDLKGHELALKEIKDMQVNEMEGELPLNALVVFRQIAAREAVKEIKKLRTDSNLLRQFIKLNHIDTTKPKIIKTKKNKFWNVFKGGNKSKYDKTNAIEVEDLQLGSIDNPTNKKSKVMKLIHKFGGKKSANDAGTIISEGNTTISEGNTTSVQPMQSSHATPDINGAMKQSMSDTAAIRSDDEDAHSEADDEDEGDPLSGGDAISVGYDSGSDTKSLSASDSQFEEDLHFDDDDDYGDDGLQETLAKYSLTNKKKTFTLRFKAATNINAQIFLDSQPIIGINLDIKCRFEKKRTRRTLIFEVDSLEIEDYISDSPINQQLVSTLGTIENMLTHFKGAMKIPPVDQTQDLFKRISPRLNFIFDTDKGCSTLNLCAMPMLVVWNEKCVQKLVQFFTMKDNPSNSTSLHAADKRNKFSADIMKKFLKQVKETSKVANTGKKSMDITIEVYTPALVFPEQYDNDMGCLRIDFSKLLIKLNKDRLNTAGTILLKNANIEMPHSFCQELETIKELGYNDSRNHQPLPKGDSSNELDENTGISSAILKIDSYIVKPFDIKFQFEKGGIINRDADNIVNISINPFIDLQIRAINIVRLNYIIDKVIKSIQKPKVKVKKTKKHKNTQEEEIVIVDPADIDFIKPKLLLHFTLPDLMVCLVVSEDHIIELSLIDLDVKVNKRWGDMSLVFELDSIALTDSKRPDSHPAILWTSNGNTMDGGIGGLIPRVRSGANALNEQDKQQQQPIRRTSVKEGTSKPIEFKYLQLTSPYSPLYEGNSKEITFKLKDCNIAVDDGSISRIVPFTTKLLNSYRLYYPDEKKKKKKKKKKTNGFGSSSMNFSMESISLDILQDISGTVAVDSNKTSIRSTPPKLNRASRRSSFYVKKPQLSAEEEALNANVVKEMYENAFHIDISNIVVQTQGMLAKADHQMLKTYITSFSITDVRKSSEKFIFKTLLSRNVGVLESEDQNIAVTIKPLSLKDNNEPKVEHILYLHLKKNLDVTDIEVFSQDITSYVSLDVMISFLDIIMSNVKALKRVKSAVKGKKKMSELQSTIKDKVVKKESKASKLLTGNIHEEKVIRRNLKLTILNPRLFLLEDPENNATKAIVTDCNIHLLVVSDIYNYETGDRYQDRTEVKNSIHFSIKQAQIFVWTNMQMQHKPHKIIEPMSVDIHLEKSTENDVNLMNYLNISSNDIRCRVSLNDIALTSSILSRAKLSKKSKVKKEKTKKVIIPDDQDDQVFKHLTMNNLHVGLGQMTFTLLNDYNNQNIPMIKANIEQFEFSCGGSSRYLDGEGTFQISADYYNSSASNVACWEPVIEPWHPTITFIKDYHGIDLSITSTNNAQFNVTGPMCRCIYNAMTLVKRIGKEGTFGTTRNAHALVVRNQLGLPIEIIDSKTKESLLILPDDLLYPILPKKTFAIRSGGEQYETESYPELFDIHLVGVTQRQPILQAPILTTKPKLFHFQPGVIQSTDEKDNQGEEGSVSSNKEEEVHTIMKDIKIITEPINEEVYENQRYYPLNGGWKAPWKSFNRLDCYPWTDIHGKQSNPPSKFVLPPKWEWADLDWRIDVGKVGVETDKDGWQYESNFTAFSSSRTKRRAQKRLDVVRRRRWVRTRIPEQIRVLIPNDNNDDSTKSNKKQIKDDDDVDDDDVDDSEIKDEWLKWKISKSKLVGMTKEDLLNIQLNSSRSLPIFWEVHTKSDESREIRISSGLRINNELHCPVEIEMVDSIAQANNISNLFIISTKETFGVPLSLACFSYFRLRPITSNSNPYETFNWCDKVSCKLRTDVSHYSTTKRISCLNSNQEAFYIAIHIGQKNKQVTVSISSSAILYNRLPCAISFDFYNATIVPNNQPYETDLLAQPEVERTKPRGFFSFASSTPKEPEESLNDLLRPYIDKLEESATAPPIPTGGAVVQAQDLAGMPPPLPPPLFESLPPPIPPPHIPSLPPVDEYEEDSSVYDNSSPPSLPPPPPIPFSPPIDEGHGFSAPNFIPPPVPPPIPPAIPSTPQDYTEVEDDKIEEFVEPESTTISALEALRNYYSLTTESNSNTGRIDENHSRNKDIQLEPGDLLPTSQVNFDEDVSITITIGDFASIVPLQIGSLNNTVSDNNTVEQVSIKEYSIWLTNRGLLDNNPDLVNISVKIIISSFGVLQIYVYSQYILADLSDSGILVRSDISVNPSETEKLRKTPLEARNIIINRQSYLPQAEMTKISIAEQLRNMLAIGSNDISACWVKGCAGLTLFQAGNDNRISLGVNNGSGWHKNLLMDTIHADKSAIEVIDPHNRKIFNLALSLTPFTTSASLCTSHVLKIMPTYVVINCMYEDLEFVHPTSDEWDDQCIFEVENQSSRPWHRPYHHSNTHVRIRTTSTTCSIGTIDLNEMGTTLLILPGRDYGTRDSNTLNELTIAHVEVKLADDDDPSYINIIIWRSVATMKDDSDAIDDNNALLAIKNETDIAFNIIQDGIEHLIQTDLYMRRSRFDLTVNPGKLLPYGWVDPRVGMKLNVCVGSRRYYGRDADLNDLPTCILDIETPDEIHTMALNEYLADFIGEIRMVLKSVGNGHILYIYHSDEIIGSGNKIYEEKHVITSNEEEEDIDKINNHDTNINDMTKEEIALNESSIALNENFELEESGRKDLTLKVKLQSISISFFAEYPKRRELFNVYLEGLEVVVRKLEETDKHGAMNSLEMKLMDMQVDNYTEDNLHAVLFSSSHHGERLTTTNQRRLIQKHSQTPQYVSNNSYENNKNDEQYHRFIHFSIVKEIPKGKLVKSAFIKYFAIRVLEFKIALDSSTILVYFSDLHRDLIRDKYYLDYNDPSTVKNHFTEFNHQILDTLLNHTGDNSIDCKKAYEKAQVKKIFFETLIVHPLKIVLSFTPTYCPRFENDPIVRGNRKLKILVSAHSKMPAIEDFEIRIGSFIINNAMETMKSMKKRIIKKTIREIKSNLMLIAGNFLNSISFFGNPTQLVKYIGTGMQDFFYEPYLGMTESPVAFVKGVGKGSVSLIKGMALSTATIVGAASDSLSTVTQGVATGITGDEEYIIVRENKRRVAKENQGGMIFGMKKGGRRVVSGVASGLTGLVIKPLEEGKKSGAMGFVKGLGIGLVGVAVKPVLGLTDGISSIAFGFTKEIIDPNSLLTRLRPARALERADHNDKFSLILVPLDLYAGEAQAFMYDIRTSHMIEFKDEEYVASCSLGYQLNSLALPPEKEFGIVISTNYIFLLSASLNEIWHVNFTNLSHVVLKNDSLISMIGFIMFGSALPETKHVVCANKHSSLKLYSFLMKFASKMGNPSAMVGSEAFTDHLQRNQEGHVNNMKEYEDPSDDITSPTLMYSNVTYVFGYVNPQGYLPHKMKSEKQILKLASESFARIALAQPADEDALFLYYRQLDEALWSLVSDWRTNHRYLQQSRCNACMILNNSPNYIQIVEIDLLEGRDYVMFGVGDIESTASIEYAYATSFDPITKSLKGNGGVLVVFAYGNHMIKGSTHVDVKIHTTGFSALISTRKNTGYCYNLPGYNAGFLEKSQSDTRSWTKSVISVDLQK